MRLIADRRLGYALAVLAVLALMAVLAASFFYKFGGGEAQASKPVPSKNLPQEMLRSVQIASPKAQPERDALIRGEKVPEHLRTTSRANNSKNQP